MIEVEDWAEIRRLHRAEGLPIKQIARIKNVSRNTVRAALRSDAPPKYEREPKGSVADGFEPRIRELLMVYPTMPASVIGERIGWPYSDRTLRTRVAELRPAYLPPDPASRTSYAAGELAFRWAVNKQLRDAICDFAGDSRHANPWAADIYRKARARGHVHPHAVRILARAWIGVIWKCWTTSTPYDPSHHHALQRLLSQDQQTAA